jgi:hypothetical protein
LEVLISVLAVTVCGDSASLDTNLDGAPLTVAALFPSMVTTAECMTSPAITWYVRMAASLVLGLQQVFNCSLGQQANFIQYKKRQ